MKSPYLHILTEYFDPCKNNTEIAREIRNAGKWDLDDHNGRKVVARYRASTEVKVELEKENQGIQNIEDLLSASNVDTSLYNVRSARIEKGKSGKLGVSVSIDKKVDSIDYLSEVKALLNNYQSNGTPRPIIIEAPVAQKDNLLVIPVFDLHFGKSNIDPSYTLQHAKDEYISLVEEIATSAYQKEGVSEVLIVFGGDLLNTDNVHYTTTKGTPQVGDGNSYQRVFRTAADAVIQSIIFLEALFDKVSIINTPGNHDQLSSFMLFEVVGAFFRYSDRVIMDNSEASRKYFIYGENAFQIAHGHKAVKDLPLLFARECREFSQKRFPLIMLGHTHHGEKKTFLGANEYTGVGMRVFNSLAKADAYHEQEGYSESIRQIDGLIFSKRKGKIGEINRIL